MNASRFDISKAWIYSVSPDDTGEEVDGNGGLYQTPPWNECYEPYSQNLTNYLAHLHRKLSQLQYLNDLDCIRIFEATINTQFKSALVVTNIVNETDSLLSVLAQEALANGAYCSGNETSLSYQSQVSLGHFASLQNGK